MEKKCQVIIRKLVTSLEGLGVANRWRCKDLYIYVSESVKAILTI